MYCPLHRYQREEKTDVCPRCEQEGMTVVECEIDKISRAIDTLDQQGYYLAPPHDGSRAILVFRKRTT